LRVKGGRWEVGGEVGWVGYDGIGRKGDGMNELSCNVNVFLKTRPCRGKVRYLRYTCR